MNPLFCIKTNKRIILGKQIASSGEGEIWTTEDPNILAKIYHRSTLQRQEKLRVMFKHPPKDPNSERNHISFAWPQSLLVNKNGKILGFLMAKIQDAKELIDIYNPRRRNKLNVKVDWHFLHVVGHNISSIIHAIHQAGYVLGDIKPQNILVNSQAVPSIIDTDSFQVTNPTTGNIYRCLVGSEGFTPPELFSQDFAQINQTEVHDRFRLGVIIYYLLFGSHPFQGKWVGQGESPEITELIRRGYWVFASDGLIKPSSLTIPLNILHPILKDCFIRCFSDGYQNPRLRPTAKEWQSALQIALNALKKCDQASQHFYHEKHSSCYWCERKEKLKMDIFVIPTKTPTPTATSRKIDDKTNELPPSSRPRVHRVPSYSPYLVHYSTHPRYKPSPLASFKIYFKNNVTRKLNRYTTSTLGNVALLASFLILLALFQGLADPNSSISTSTSSTTPKREPKSSSKQQALAIAYNNQGYQKYNQKDYIGAIADFNQALKLYPDLVDAYYNRGLANQALGHDKLAEQDLFKAISINSHFKSLPESTPAFASAEENQGLEKLSLNNTNELDNEVFQPSSSAKAELEQRLAKSSPIDQLLQSSPKIPPSNSSLDSADSQSIERILQDLDTQKKLLPREVNHKKVAPPPPKKNAKLAEKKSNQPTKSYTVTTTSHLAFSFFQRGVINKRQGNYREAIANFEQAYFLLKKEGNPDVGDLEKMIQDLRTKVTP